VRFQKEGGKTENALMIAATAGHEPIVRMLLNNGAALALQDDVFL